MLADDEASRRAWLGADPGGESHADGVLDATPAAGALDIECSTLSHGWVSELAARARRPAGATWTAPSPAYRTPRRPDA